MVGAGILGRSGQAQEPSHAHGGPTGGEDRSQAKSESIQDRSPPRIAMFRQRNGTEGDVAESIVGCPRCPQVRRSPGSSGSRQSRETPRRRPDKRHAIRLVLCGVVAVHEEGMRVLEKLGLPAFAPPLGCPILQGALSGPRPRREPLGERMGGSREGCRRPE
jgi:hypothetical protein